MQTVFTYGQSKYRIPLLAFYSQEVIISISFFNHGAVKNGIASERNILKGYNWIALKPVENILAKRETLDHQNSPLLFIHS